MATVTVTSSAAMGSSGKEWTLEFSRLPGQKFGPYGFTEVIGQLRIAALLSPLDARNLVMDAVTQGTVTAETDTDAS